MPLRTIEKPKSRKLRKRAKPKHLLSLNDRIKTPRQKADWREARIIMRHKCYVDILNSLREGEKPNDIAIWLGERGELKVNHNTFAGYIRAFKRVFPSLVEEVPFGSIDHIMSMNKPALDKLKQMERMIRIQARRVAICVNREEERGRPTSATRMEIKVYVLMIEKLHKMKIESALLAFSCA